jgi:GNAT superfamily N-acetyltransferase
VTLRLTRRQILAFRRRVSGLEERMPIRPESLWRAAWAGLQNSMPRAALLSLHARLDGVEPSTLDEHPEAARYHRGWGRPGDLGVIASAADQVVAVAYCRLFTDDDHGYGYVDDETPEIAVAVRDGFRGRGLGAQLLTELAAAARAAGFRRLSLSVETANPARRLYERLGYRMVSVDGDAVRMVLDLD